MAGDELPRRDFLKTAGFGTAAALAGSVCTAAAAEAATEPATTPEPEGRQMTAAAAISPHLRIFGAVVLLVFIGWVVRLVRTERLTLRDSPHRGRATLDLAGQLASQAGEGADRRELADLVKKAKVATRPGA